MATNVDAAGKHHSTEPQDGFLENVVARWPTEDLAGDKKIAREKVCDENTAQHAGMTAA